MVAQTIPLRIAVASSGLGHVARGIEGWAHELARALAVRGATVALYKGGGQPEAANERVLPCWQRDAAKTQRLMHWLPRRGLWRLGLGSGYGIEQTTFALSLVRQLRRERTDILHVQDPHVAFIVQRARRLGLVRTRTVLGHGTEEPPSFLSRIEYLQHLSPWQLEWWRAQGVWRPTWTAIPNFLDTDLFRPGHAPALREELGIPSDGLVVLTVAAIKRGHKRIDHLLGEFARLRTARPDLPVWFVIAGGREAETEELMQLGRSLLGDRVRFLVGMPRSKMPELYRAADLFTLGSLSEMMPLAVLEATSSGLPCLVNRHPVLEWMSGPGGRVVDMEAPSALAGALQELLTDRAKREQLGRQARTHCVEHFRRDRVVDQILSYYLFVRSHRSARRGACLTPSTPLGDTLEPRAFSFRLHHSSSQS
jgi:1,2-diacylglycerol 3-alpha-glucosyltransferase